MLARWSMVLVAVGAIEIAALAGAASQSKLALDYDFYKNRVEPIFLKKKAGHTRCAVCHSESNNAFRLEKMPAHGAAWTEEQSRRNFEMVAKLVNPGDPMVSRLLMHPLAPEGGGDVYHSGGRQFASIKDADWKVMADWVNGAKPGAPSKKR